MKHFTPINSCLQIFRFTELFTIILNSGPSLVQRALGRGGVSGSALLLQLILKQLESEAWVTLFNLYLPFTIYRIWLVGTRLSMNVWCNQVARKRHYEALGRGGGSLPLLNTRQVSEKWNTNESIYNNILYFRLFVSHYKL